MFLRHLQISQKHAVSRSNHITSITRMASTNNSQPSMLGGHAQYAKGYVEETVGNVTGSKEWQASGKADAESGIAEMKVS